MVGFTVMKTNQSAIHIGVRVGKHQPDLFYYVSDEHFTTANLPFKNNEKES